MEIRPATTDDLDELVDLYEAVAAERIHIGAEPPIDRARRKATWLEDMTADNSCRFVAVADGRIVGDAALVGSTLAELGMHVAKDWRGRGAGRRLLEACIDWARHAGAYKITLQVWPHNTAAIGLYERYGFEREGYLRKQWRRQNGELWDAVVMGLVLDPSTRPPGHPSDQDVAEQTCGH